MKIVGHRGARGLIFENTLPSIKKAIEIGVDAVEFDLHATKDNHLVLQHDKNLKRMYGIDAGIKNHTLAELKALTKSFEYPINSFDEVMEEIKDFPIYLELKDQTITADLIEPALKKYPQANVMGIISFEKKIILRYKKIGGKRLTYLAPYKKNFMYIIQTAKNIKSDGVVPHYSSLSSPIHLYWARLYRLTLVPYPINSMFWAKMYLFFAPNAILVTDYPDRLVKLKKN